MWDSTVERLYGGEAQRIVPRRDGLPVPYAEVLRRWQEDEGFRSFLNGLLAGSPFASFRWETPPITAGTADREFEFVLLDAPGLDCTPDGGTFADHFAPAAETPCVVAFPNLRNDAVLVVPCPCGDPNAYVHLAAFIRDAPEMQKHELWRVVGAAMETRLDSRPVWLSTAGMGVSWLHVRLDSRPKYYGFAPYREAA